ncbi:hypothetical protein [Mixta gaviniae]|uniref:hypothetical protein n=1 Tax=Mixta gaviniae TaxID=665914 RepID=UPI00142DAEAC|nr:hypothetical protein [Mixta gaviniae]
MRLANVNGAYRTEKITPTRLKRRKFALRKRLFFPVKQINNAFSFFHRRMKL